MRADQMMSRQVIIIGVDAALVDAITTMLKYGVSGLWRRLVVEGCSSGDTTDDKPL